MKVSNNAVSIDVLSKLNTEQKGFYSYFIDCLFQASQSSQEPISFSPQKEN